MSKEWLNDTIIDASMSLLKFQFPDIKGLQTCSRAGSLSFDRQSNNLFIQIINRTPTGSGSHWLTISNIKAKNLSKEVVVYESAFTYIPGMEAMVISSLLEVEGK